MATSRMMVCNRNLVVHSGAHGVSFRRGVPARVAAALIPNAQFEGAEFVADEAAAEAAAAAAVAADTPPAIPYAEGTEERAIFDVIALLADENAADNFGANGKPHVKSIEQILGKDITADQRDAVWAAFDNHRRALVM